MESIETNNGKELEGGKEERKGIRERVQRKESKNQDRRKTEV